MALAAEPQLLSWWSFDNELRHHTITQQRSTTNAHLKHKSHAQHLPAGSAGFGYYDAKQQRLYAATIASATGAQALPGQPFIDTGALVGDNFKSGRSDNWGAYKGTTIGRPSMPAAGAKHAGAAGALAISGSANNRRFFQIVADLSGYREVLLCWVERRTASGFRALEVSVSEDEKRFAALSISGAVGKPKRWVRRRAVVGDRLARASRAVIRFTLRGATHPRGNVRVDNIALYAGVGASDKTPCETGDKRPPPPPSPIAKPVSGVRQVTIAAIQGRGAQSQYRDQRVSTSGVVTAVFQRAKQLGGFFMQQQPADNDRRTSDGIFVIANTPQMRVGDRVTLSARVIEQPGPRRKGASGALGVPASRTALVEAAVEAIERRGSAPPIAPTPLRLPQQAGQLERFEGMLVSLSAGDRVYTVIDTGSLWRYGQLALASPDLAGRVGRLYQPTQWHLPGSSQWTQLEAENRRRRIVLDDGSEATARRGGRLPWYLRDALPTLRIGDTLVSGLVGILDFGSLGGGAKTPHGYRLQAVGAPELRHANPRPPPPREKAGTLRIASYNAENYFTTLGRRGAANVRARARQRRKTNAVLRALNADIIALQEIENNRAAIKALTEELNRSLGSRVYAAAGFGIVGTDRIRSALLYRRAVLQLLGRAAVLDDSVDQRALSRRNRPTIARSFVHRASGERLTVAVAHFKSKGSSCARPLRGYRLRDAKRADGQGHCNLTRVSAARALIDWLGGDPTVSDDPDIVIVGDLNAYAREDPLRVLEAAGYVNVIRRDVGRAAYGYHFRGASGYLSYMLASASLAPRVGGVQQYHINADEPRRLGYRSRAGDSKGEATPFRASDHDPVIIEIDVGGG